MAFDEQLATRIRLVLAKRRGVSERKMFGGLAFLVNGHMCCGVIERNLVLRLGNELVARSLKTKHTRPMDFTGKPIKSMIYVRPSGYKSDVHLRRWILKALQFVKSLPPK